MVKKAIDLLLSFSKNPFLGFLFSRRIWKNEAISLSGLIILFNIFLWLFWSVKIVGSGLILENADSFSLIYSIVPKILFLPFVVSLISLVNIVLIAMFHKKNSFIAMIIFGTSAIIIISAFLVATAHIILLGL